MEINSTLIIFLQSTSNKKSVRNNEAKHEFKDEFDTAESNKSKAHGRDDLFDRRSLNEWKPETGNGFLIFKRCQMSGLINDVVVTFDLFVC
jgi:hypothetical protein